MRRSQNFNFYLPSRDTDDVADINQISENFMTIDEELSGVLKGKGVDQVYNPNSANPQSGKAVSGELVKYVKYEENSEWIFDGGDSEGNVDVDLVIDGEMSDASENPVMNKTVKAYVDRAKDFIVEQGTAEVKVNEGTDDEFVATWTYRKWNSGIAECWTASCRVISPFTTAWGTLYMSDKSFPQIEYPISFTVAPICNFDLAYLDSAAGYFFDSSIGGLDIYKYTPKIYAWSPISYVNTREITARISVIGTWK